MYKASSYFALGGNNCYMQIGCHKAHAVGSCPERPTWKNGCLHCQNSISDISLQKQSRDRHWRILLRTGSALILLRYLFVLGLCSLMDRLVMMGAVWEFCWSRLVGRRIPFPSE